MAVATELKIIRSKENHSISCSALREESYLILLTEMIVFQPHKHSYGTYAQFVILAKHIDSYTQAYMSKRPNSMDQQKPGAGFPHV